MSKRKRTFLFKTFLSLFLISILPIVFYTQGYRIDFDELRLVETGGIDLNINTLNAKIYLQDELEKETSFIFRSAVFRNILPGNYNTLVKKEGYKSWQKKILVRPGQVSKFGDIILFPDVITPTLLVRNAQNVFLSPNMNFALVQSESNISGTTNTQKRTQLFLSDNVRETLEPVLVLQSGENVKEILWSPNSDIFFIFIQSKKSNFLYSGSTGRSQELINWSAFLKNSFPVAYDTDSIRVPTNSAEVLYVFQKDTEGAFSLNKIEITEGLIYTNILQNMVAYEIIDDNIFYLNKKGILFVANITSKESKQLSSTSVSETDVNSKITVREDGQIIAILNRGDLFLWETEKPLTKIAENAVGISFASDKEKLLYWNNEELNIYWTKKVFGPPSRVPGDREIISEYSNIKNADWISNSSSHIVFQTADTIVFAELDSRDRRNEFKYEVITSPNTFGSDKSAQKIYTIFDGDFVFFNYE